MARLITYSREDVPDENDILIGTDVQSRQSKNFVLGNLKVFFNEGISSIETFEIYSKDLKQYPYILNYNQNQLSSIVYSTLNGTIVKTFTYASNRLSLITLSGDLDESITKNKQFNYTDDKLTSVTYF